MKAVLAVVSAALMLSACAADVVPAAIIATPPAAIPTSAESVPPETQNTAPVAPRVAYHQHLFSPRTAALIKQPLYLGVALVADLDRAGIDRGVVLSMAYTFADERKKVTDVDRQVREENDWTAAEVGRSNGRLIGFCSVNPLRASAVAEVARCTRLPNILGLKPHFANSGVDLRDDDHVDKVRRVFATANAARAPIIVHMRLRSTAKSDYGAEDARLFIDKLLPVAPDIVVQVAHLTGSGSFPEDAEKAMSVFAEAIAKDDPRTRSLFFDITTVAMAESTKADGEYIAKAIRSVGPERILFGTDAPTDTNPDPAGAWQLFRVKVPLTDAEFATIAANMAPYLEAK